MGIVRQLQIQAGEWVLLQDLSAYTAPFYLKDIFILNNREGLTQRQFYSQFFSLQINGFITVGGFTDYLKPGYSNVLYQLSDYAKSVIEKHRQQ